MNLLPPALLLTPPLSKLINNVLPLKINNNSNPNNKCNKLNKCNNNNTSPAVATQHLPKVAKMAPKVLL